MSENIFPFFLMTSQFSSYLRINWHLSISFQSFSHYIPSRLSDNSRMNYLGSALGRRGENFLSYRLLRLVNFFFGSQLI
ncbi:MAG: hypothetical protein ABIN58_13870 [candidate division WOR-3 bacterium]